MKGIAIDGNVPRSEAAGDKFFRILRFFAPTVCAIHRERGRVVRSSARSRRSLAAKRTTDLADGCGAPANRYALSLSLSSLLFPPWRFPPSLPLSLSDRGGCAFRPRFRFSRTAFFPRRYSPMPPAAVIAVRAPPALRRFYLIALLCFIEQLLRSRAVCFFFLRSLYRKQLCP